jgi:hypothetical protein
VVAVKVRVQDKLELPGIELLQCRLNLFGERRELIVHNQNSVRADRHADVSAGAFEHVNVFRDGNRFDFDFGKVALGQSGKGEESQGGSEKQLGFHGRSLAQGRTEESPNPSEQVTLQACVNLVRRRPSESRQFTHKESQKAWSEKAGVCATLFGL